MATLVFERAFEGVFLGSCDKNNLSRLRLFCVLYSFNGDNAWTHVLALGGALDQRREIGAGPNRDRNRLLRRGKCMRWPVREAAEVDQKNGFDFIRFKNRAGLFRPFGQGGCGEGNEATH